MSINISIVQNNQKKVEDCNYGDVVIYAGRVCLVCWQNSDKNEEKYDKMLVSLENPEDTWNYTDVEVEVVGRLKIDK